MAHTKTGISVTPPIPVDPPPPVVGEERGGEVWDGEKWITPEEWEKIQEDQTRIA
jgi:hypothetical protein